MLNRVFEDERSERFAPYLLEVFLALSDLLKAGFTVERNSGGIVFSDFQKNFSGTRCGRFT